MKTKVIITIEDDEHGEISLNAQFDPPMDPNNPEPNGPAQMAALSMMNGWLEELERRDQDLRDIVDEGDNEEAPEEKND